MPFRSTAQQRFAFGTGQPWAKRWADETDFSKIPKRVRKKMKQLKDAGTVAGAMLAGPGGLLATPGLGGRRWGNRKKAAGCTCGENVATKESLGPGITRIRGNLCNVHGRYGPCDAAQSGKKKPKGGKGKKPKATPAPERDHNQERIERRDQVLADMGIDPGASEALVMLRNGEQPEPAAMARMGAVEAGLVEQAADGSYRMTPSGRALMSAAEGGDPGRAGDIISAARDRKAARTAREREAAQKKLDAATKRAEAAAAKKPAKGSGGGKGSSSSSGGDREAERQNQRQIREDERQADRKKREEERQADRKKREEERQEDRATRQRERSEDRAAQLAERRQRSRGTVPSRGAPVQMPRRGRRPNAVRSQTGNKRPPVTLQSTKAQSAQDRAMFAKMGGGGGGGGKGGGGGGSKLWPRNPDTGKREPPASAAPKGMTIDQVKQRDADIRKDRQKDESKLEDAMARGDYARADQIKARIDKHNQDLKDLEKTSIISPPAGQTVRQHEARQRAEYAKARDSAEREATAAGRRYQEAQDAHRGSHNYPATHIDNLRREYEEKKRRVSEFADLAREKSYDSTFTVFKDDTDAYRWLARTTTAYRDRDGEIITTKALEQDAERMTATHQYGPLRYWHIGNPDPFNVAEPWGQGLDIGTTDYSVVIGRTSIESGTFKSHAIGRAFAEHAADYELSPGFFHPPDQPNASGEYEQIRRFERSVVPVTYGRASNLFTGMTVKGERMDQATYDARVKAFLEDMNRKGVPESAAAAALSGMQQADKSATAQGIAFKSDDAPQVFTAPDGTQGIIQDGRFVALKAAAEVAEVVETKDDGEGDMEVMAEEVGEAEEDAGGGEYIGDMTPAEFWAQLQQYLAPVLKMQEMVKAIGDAHGELKTMYATKDAGVLAEIAQLKAKLAELEGDQPAVVVSADVDAALKSSGPQSPPSADGIEVPDRPFADTTAALFPSLYGGAVAGYNGADGWRLGQLPPNSGGN